MADEIKAGIIGCDTSHVIAFAERFHEKEHAQHVPGVRIVAAYPSFSPDVENSVGRVEGFKKQLAERWKVEIVESIGALVERVDAILIESVDGRRHRPELEAVASAGKPVFVDKPFAASLDDAKAMVKLIRERKLPCWSASSLRFDSKIVAAAEDLKACGKILGCDAYGPAHLEPTNPGLFWYGIHGVEILYTIMGPGCRTVRGSSTPDGDLAVGVWKDDRIGTMRGIRKGKAGYGAALLCEKRPPTIVEAAGDYYQTMLKAIVTFFRTGESPVPIDETLEMCAFMDAAWRSAKSDCGDVAIKL